MSARETRAFFELCQTKTYGIQTNFISLKSMNDFHFFNVYVQDWFEIRIFQFLERTWQLNLRKSIFFVLCNIQNGKLVAKFVALITNLIFCFYHFNP